jgi:hypothetical protein
MPPPPNPLPRGEGESARASFEHCNPQRCKSRRVKRWPTIDPILKFTIGLFLIKCFNRVSIQYQYSSEFHNYLPSFLCHLGVIFQITGSTFSRCLFNRSDLLKHRTRFPCSIAIEHPPPPLTGGGWGRVNPHSRHAFRIVSNTDRAISLSPLPPLRVHCRMRYTPLPLAPSRWGRGNGAEFCLL